MASTAGWMCFNQRRVQEIGLRYPSVLYTPLCISTIKWFWFVCPFQAILAGDFILSAATKALARIGNCAVVKVLSQVIEDLVRGALQHLQHLFVLHLLI